MYQPIPILVENSFQIAWDYLERTGELGNPEVASQVLIDTIVMMIRRGERRKLLILNNAITSMSTSASGPNVAWSWSRSATFRPYPKSRGQKLAQL
jgi:hypothetical protein